MNEKYSVTILAKSGDRELTKVVYPCESYIEFVGVQSAISMGLLRAGVQRAVGMGEDVPEPMLKMFGVEGK